MTDLFIASREAIPRKEGRRLAAWIVVTGAYGRAFANPAIYDERAPDPGSLIDAVMIPRRLKREQEAAGIELVRRAGREAWRIHQQRGGAS